MAQDPTRPDYGAHCYQLALAHQRQGQFEQADKYFLLAVNHNHPPALFRMGLQFQAVGNYTLALRWYRRAADLGDGNGRFRVWCFERHKIPPVDPKDIDQATFWFRYGKLYINLPYPDCAAALMAFEEAHRLGHPEAEEWARATRQRMQP